MINQKYLNYVALVLILIGAIWIFRTNEKESWKKVAQTLINNEFHGKVFCMSVNIPQFYKNDYI